MECEHLGAGSLPGSANNGNGDKKGRTGTPINTNTVAIPNAWRNPIEDVETIPSGRIAGPTLGDHLPSGDVPQHGMPKSAVGYGGSLIQSVATGQVTVFRRLLCSCHPRLVTHTHRPNAESPRDRLNCLRPGSPRRIPVVRGAIGEGCTSGIFLLNRARNSLLSCGRGRRRRNGQSPIRGAGVRRRARLSVPGG